MIKNYFKTAWRSLIRNKTFSVINISGLTLGLACALLIILWVNDERTVDGFHKNGDQLYQVYERWSFDGKIEASYPTQGLLAEELKRVIPEVQFASGFEYAGPPGSQNNFEAGDKVNKMGGMFAGADFFNMFSYPLLQGSDESALNAPNSIVISRKMADYFFGGAEQAMGQAIRFENKEDLKVTAVFENVPANSSQQFDFLRSWIDFKKQNEWINNWGNTSPATFIQLRKGADIASVKVKVKDFIYRYLERNDGTTIELDLQPYTQKYLFSNFKNGYVAGGRIEYVRLFTIVAIFVLLIACINFMNLATARSVKRAKEVGLRKVVGAVRSSLIGQFIGEAMFLTFLSLVLAVITASLFLPIFNQLTGKELSLPFSEPVFWVSAMALLIITGFIAGSYPALFLSSLNPVKVFKGSMKFGSGAVFFRKGLVVFQFSLSIILIISMIVISQQINYIQSKNLGYDRDNLIYIPIEGDLVKEYSLFKEEGTKMTGIESISKMRNSPTVIEHHTGSIEWAGKDKNQFISFADAVVGYDFVKTAKLQLKEGRDFSKEFGTDSASYMLNETAAKKIGFKEAMGQTVTWGNRPGKIIGVLKDFHFSSMHSAIDPLIIRLDENWGWGTILIRINGSKTKEAIAGLERICKEVNPKFPFTYRFSDIEFENLYRSEQLVSKLSDYFAALAIFISCLGLLGLAAFTASQKNKEIGIRKVLGASVGSITAMLSKDFVKLVLIAILIGAPVAWWAMSKWLENFAYRIAVSWWMIVVAGLAAVLIALITISFQSIKAALVNPVKSLRSE